MGLKVGGVDFFIDLGAEKLLAAERDGQFKSTILN
jgi:hypothetical protein